MLLLIFLSFRSCVHFHHNPGSKTSKLQKKYALLNPVVALKQRKKVNLIFWQFKNVFDNGNPFMQNAPNLSNEPVQVRLTTQPKRPCKMCSLGLKWVCSAWWTIGHAKCVALIKSVCAWRTLAHTVAKWVQLTRIESL